MSVTIMLLMNGYDITKESQLMNRKAWSIVGGTCYYIYNYKCIVVSDFVQGSRLVT